MPLKTQQFQVDAAGKKYWGVIYTPIDYATNPDPCALICFSHGIGEAGTTEASASRVIGLSPLYPAQQADTAGKLFTYNDPAGKPHRFIVIALQAPSWSPSPENWKYVLDNDLFKNYKINKNAVYKTGLSAGGQTTTTCITSPGTIPYFAAAVPMSPAYAGHLANLDQTIAAKIKVWGFSGSTDGNFTLNLQKLVSSMNAKAPGSAKATIYPGGHGGWNTYYNPTYKEDGKNIYEWMLANMKGATTPPPTPTPTPTGPVIKNFGSDETITGTAIVVDVSASTGVASVGDAYRWGFTALPPAAGEPAPSWGAQPIPAGVYGGPKKSWPNLKPGKYKVTLTVKGTDGTTATASKTVTVK